MSNIYITSKEIMNNENFSTYLSDLSSTSWSSNQSHKLIIDVEDSSTGKYDSAKIISAISRFKSVVGNDNAYVVIKSPKNIR